MREAERTGFLTKKEILALQDDKPPAIQDLDGRLLTEWAYDLRVGAAYLATSNKHINDDGAIVSIEPGEFALLLTKERLNVPLDHVGFISLKFTHALKGLVNVSGFHVDPGYQGKILFSVYNAGPNPVTLRLGDPLFMVIFNRLAHPVSNGRPEGIERIEAKHISQVRGPSQSLVTLGERVEKLEHRFELLMGLLIAVVAGLVLALLRLG